MSIKAARSTEINLFWEEISGGADVLKLGNREVNSRAYVGRFNFSGSDQQKKVSMLLAANGIEFIWRRC